MTDLATIRIPVDSSDMVKAVQDTRRLEREIKLLFTAFDSGAIGSKQFSSGLLQLKREFEKLFDTSAQATARIRGFAKSLAESAEASRQAAAAKKDLAEATARAETAFALANQRAKEELTLSKQRAETAFALAMQKEEELRLAQKAEQSMRNQARAFGELVNKVNTYQDSMKSVTESGETFIRILREQELQALKTARANQQSINAQLGISGPRATERGAGFGAMEAEIERLALKYNKVYASSKLYESSLEELNRAHRFGAISADQYAREVDQLNLEYQQFVNGATNFSNRFVQYDQSLVTSMKSTNRFGMIAQQVGYQVGDFFVQVQSGTNAFVAFGQQATQLAGLIPGVGGAIAGIGISIGTMFLAAWDRTRQAREGVDELAEAIKTLKEQTKEANEQISLLGTGFTNLTEKRIADRIAELNIEEQKALSQLEAAALLGGLGGASGQVAAKNLESIRAQRNELQGITEERREQINLETELFLIFKRAADANRLERENKKGRVKDRLEGEKILAQMREEIALLTIGQQFGAESLQVKQLIAYQEKLAFKAMVDALAISEEHREELMSAYNAMVLLRRETDAYKNSIAAAANSASVLASKLDISFENAKKLLAAGRDPTQPIILDPRDPRYDPIRARMQLAKEEQERLSKEFSKPEKEERLKKEKKLVEELTEAEKRRKEVLESIESSLESGFMAMVEGTKSVKDAFKLMARDIIAELYRVFVVQRITGMISGALGGNLVSGPGFGLFSRANFAPPPRPVASGGSIVPGGTYLVGEKGPEIIRPRHSGTVVPAHLSGKEGGSAFTQNLTINVSGSDAANVRMEVAKMIPQITEATKAAVIDARRRGGQMKAAFG